MSEQKTLNRLSSPQRKDIVGDKVPFASLVNCEFIIEDFVEMDTEYGHTALCQIEVEKEKRSTFISNPYLIELLQRNREVLPALVTLRLGEGQGNRKFYYFE